MRTEADLRVASTPQHNLEIVRGEGALLFAADGRTYVDAGASHGACNLGHAHPDVVRAIQEQAGQLGFISSSFRNDARHRFLDVLIRAVPAPLERAFLSNSGAEAVEAALKFARSATGRPGFVAARRAFHGRTFGALSVTWREDHRAPFEPLLPNVAFAAFNDVESLKQAVGPQTAAVILEPVQGEGGVHVADAEFLRAARDVCDDLGALLILDEVQTGLGRTGKLFAFEWAGVTPDILCLAKSLANGVPIGATLVTAEVHARLQGAHNSTFGGNPLACAAGAATLEAILRERLWERADRLGNAFREELRALDSHAVRAVRGLGLMVAVELRGKASPVLEKMAENGFLALASGTTTLRFLPPLVISPAQLHGAAKALAEATIDG